MLAESIYVELTKIKDLSAEVGELYYKLSELEN